MDNEPLKYTAVKHSFGGMGETIRAVIRFYNDVNLPDDTITRLMEEFNKLNEGSLPPRLGSSAMVPVLDEFMPRYIENQSKKNKIHNQ